MNKNGTSLAALLLAVALQGCQGVPVQVNLIQSVEPAPGQTPALDTRMTFHVKGSGTCALITVDWGDDTVEETGACPVTTDASGQKHFQCEVTHFYSGWGGGKTVTAIAKKDRTSCEGRVNTRFNMPPPSYALGFNRPGPTICNSITNRPALATRTLVKITTEPTTGRCGGIRYPDGHCYDAEGGGVPIVIDPAPVYPFPGMRVNSLVLRVGTQVVQGGVNMSFITNQSAVLELCVNEVDPKAGNGGYVVRIATDQLGPAP